MRKLRSFNFISLDGYFEGPEKGNISWHKNNKEDDEYAIEMLKRGSTLLFGRISYEMMARYWRSGAASKRNAVLAERMNHSKKIVFSRTLLTADWENTEVISEHIEEAVLKLLQVPGDDLTLLGSASILSQFTNANLIDEYQIMIDPVVLGKGFTLFQQSTLDLKLMYSRLFSSGAIILTYQPVVYI